MPPAILHTSTSLLRYVAEPAARSLALACFAAAVLAAFRARSTSTQLIVWRAMLAAALAMPLLGFFAPRVSVPVPMPSFEKKNAVVPSAPAPAPSIGDTQEVSVSIPESPRAISAAAKTPEDKNRSLLASSPATTRPPFHIAWPVVAAAVYIAIAILLLARILIGIRYAGRLEQASSPVEDPRVLQALLRGASAAGLKKPPRAAESDMLSVPVTLGVRAPVVMLPAGWRDWESGELESVLSHEVSHVARRDALTQRLALIHRAIFWFSPLSWWLDRKLADLSERASDEAALAQGADRTRYAEMLLGFFAVLEGSPERVWWQGVSMAKAGQAERRVNRILAWRGAMSNRMRKSLVVALAAFAAPAVVLTAAVHPTVYNFNEPALASPAGQDPAPAAEPTVRAQVLPEPAPRAEAPRTGIRSTPATPSAAPLAEAVPVPSIPPVAAIASLTPPGAAAAPQTVNSESHTTRYVSGRFDDWGPRFVIVTKGSEGVIMSGSEEDADHARGLRSKIPGDFIWFERDEKSYIIRDQATVERAKKFWEGEEELSRKQEELGKQQEALGKQQEDLGRKMEEVRVKIPDMTAELQAVMAKMKELSANGGTQEELGELQSQIGELQSRVGEIQSDAGRQQGSIGREQGELGRKQGELGRQQGELGRQQGELSRRASRQMRELISDALAHGTAQPE